MKETNAPAAGRGRSRENERESLVVAHTFLNFKKIDFFRQVFHQFQSLQEFPRTVDLVRVRLSKHPPPPRPLVAMADSRMADASSKHGRMPPILRLLLAHDCENSKKLLALVCAATKPGQQFWKIVVKTFLELLDLRHDHDCQTPDASAGIKDSTS